MMAPGRALISLTRMRVNRRAAGQLFWRAVLCSFLLFAFFACTSQAQRGPAKQSDASAAATPTVALAGVHGAVNLDGPWKFRAGDDESWADPGMDDSSWQPVNLSQSLAEQGFDAYTGYAWYRLKLQPAQLAQFSSMTGGQSLALLVTGNSVGQFSAYVNGYEIGHTRGLTDSPTEYASSPLLLAFPTVSSGPVVIAVKTWIGPKTTSSRGILRRVEIGGASDLAERQAMAIGQQWNKQATFGLVLAFLFLCVAVLGGALYLAQVGHSEYMWLAILCVTAATERIIHAMFGLGILSLRAFAISSSFCGFIFMAITLEFVLRFTESKSKRVVRALQIVALLVPFLQFLPSETLATTAWLIVEGMFCAAVTVLLYGAWRRGRGDAGAMLVPFFLVAATDLITMALSFAASRNWIAQRFGDPVFHVGPIEYSISNIDDLIFLSSLIAVILYRFVHISQEEQKSAAEISAAKSVQALLIPTQLPSNKNYMLESAYLPVHGVGGDFFQVLPLKDDSLLIVVGDVSGKGLQAAMNSSTLVGALRNELSHDPATVLKHLNHVLIGAVASPGTAVKELDCAPCYATCLCARVYPDGTVTIANAGHLSPYRDGREVALMPSLPLGVIAEAEYEATTFQLNRGDRLVFLSDGVVEAQNDQGELFGFERTQQVANESARYIAQTAKHFGQTDDITVLSLYLASRTAQASREELVYR